MGVYEHAITGTRVAVPDGSPSDAGMARDSLWETITASQPPADPAAAPVPAKPDAAAGRPEVPVDEDGWRQVAADLGIKFAEIKEAVTPHGGTVLGYGDVAALDTATQTAILDDLYPSNETALVSEVTEPGVDPAVEA